MDIRVDIEIKATYNSDEIIRKISIEVHDTDSLQSPMVKAAEHVIRDVKLSGYIF